MSFPIYDEHDARYASHDGNEEIGVFADFISQLNEQGLLDHPAEKGIVALVDAKGTAALTDNQAKVLSRIVDRYSNEECKLCGEAIPLNEVLYHEMNDRYCSYHKHQADKDFE